MAKAVTCDLCEILSEKEIVGIVEKSLKRKDFQVSECEVRPAGEAPMGFLGEHHILTVRATVEDGTLAEVSFFVKRTPRSVPQHEEYALGLRAFYKEIELYRTLFVDLKNAQGDRATKWCPEYFHSRGEEMIVLEDLSRDGYRMLGERTPLPEEHVRAAIRAVAAMHAASFVFEDRYRRGQVATVSPSSSVGKDAHLGALYAHLTYETEVCDADGHIGKTFMEVGIRSQAAVVDLLGGYSAEEKATIKRRLSSVLRRIFPLVKPSERYGNVFVHGDLWANNLLFREDRNGTVLDAMIIDFQLARYAPPAHDLMMLLHLVQTADFRREKETEMIDYYYSCLGKELAKNRLSAERVLPKETFLESCRDYAELGIVSAVLYFQLTMAPPKVSSKFMGSPEQYQKVILVDRSEMIQECFREDELFRTRMTEAMDELIRRHILV